MLSNSYSKAYTEVYEILNSLDQTEISSIPKEELDFIKENRDMDYEFKLDENADLDKYEFSRETYSIMIYLYKEYIASSTEKADIEELLNKNQKIIEDEKREKYNPNNIFQNTTNVIESKEENKTIKSEVEINNSLIKESDSWFQKIKNMVVEFFEKFKK